MWKICVMAAGLGLLVGCGGAEEANETPEINAEPVEVGTAYNLTITQDEARTKYYALPVTAGATYSIDVINDASSSNMISVQLLATGFEREVLGRQRMVSFDYEANETGELLIKIEGSSRAFFRYLLTVHPSVDDGLVQDDASYEPNNSRYAAYPIVNGAEYASTLDQNDDVDWYALNVVRGDSVTLVLTNDVASTSFLHPQLFDQNGLPLTRAFVVSPHTGGLNEQVTVDFTGRVFLKIEGQSPGTPHRYSFNMTLAANGG